MNKILICGILCLSILSGCKKDDDSITMKSETKRTVLMYLFQDTNLWEDLTLNINEVEQGWNEDIDGTMLVYVDASTNITQFDGKPVLLEIKHDNTDLIVSKVVKVYADRDATDANVFKQVQEDAIALYPALSYGLIIGGHGDGFLVNKETKGLGGSDRWGYKGLDIDVIAKNVATHYDFMILDACLMGETTTLYQLRNATDFVMASVELSAVEGFGYRNALAALFTQPKADLYTFSSKSCRYFNEDPIGQASRDISYLTFGVYRMSEAEKVASVTKKAIETLNLQYNQLREAVVEIIKDPKRGIQTSMYYPDYEDPRKPDYYDMGLLVELLKERGQDALAKELKNALRYFVIQSHFALSADFYSRNPDYEMYTENVSFYLPNSAGSTTHNDNAFYNRFDWAAAAGFSPKWETIVSTHSEIKEKL